MALRALMLKKRLDEKRAALASLQGVDFATREKDLEKAIDEAKTEEERSVVDEAIEAYEKEKKENAEAIRALETDIEGLEADLSEIEDDAKASEKDGEEIAVEKEKEKEEKAERRITMPTLEKRVGLYALTRDERSAIMDNGDVKAFLTRARECMAEKRALTNVGLTIPQVMLPLLRQIVEANSKLAGRVFLRRISGTGRTTVMGAIPEAVWTEMCGKLNELDLGFNDVEVDGYKVGGFFAVCNAVLEDSDLDLANELLTSIGVAIAKALDKAIVYGTGTKMPLGIVTRLAQTAEPDDYPATARTWADLHESNVITGTGASGLNLFKEIAAHKKAIKNDYYSDGLIWIMSENTHLDLLIASMDKNLNAAVVAGVADTMPVVGGEIVELNCVPDGNVVVGYGKAYLLAERAGVKLGQSEHVRFIDDQTVFKGTARYDGTPAIAEAFAVFTIDNKAPVTSGITFAADTANA